MKSTLLLILFIGIALFNPVYLSRKKRKKMQRRHKHNKFLRQWELLKISNIKWLNWAYVLCVLVAVACILKNSPLSWKAFYAICTVLTPFSLYGIGRSLWKLSIDEAIRILLIIIAFVYCYIDKVYFIGY